MKYRFKVSAKKLTNSTNIFRELENVREVSVIEAENSWNAMLKAFDALKEKHGENTFDYRIIKMDQIKDEEI